MLLILETLDIPLYFLMSFSGLSFFYKKFINLILSLIGIYLNKDYIIKLFKIEFFLLGLASIFPISHHIISNFIFSILAKGIITSLFKSV
jgi:hypothetical protein